MPSPLPPFTRLCLLREHIASSYGVILFYFFWPVWPTISHGDKRAWYSTAGILFLRIFDGWRLLTLSPCFFFYHVSCFFDIPVPSHCRYLPLCAGSRFTQGRFSYWDGPHAANSDRVSLAMSTVHYGTCTHLRGTPSMELPPPKFDLRLACPVLLCQCPRLLVPDVAIAGFAISLSFMSLDSCLVFLFLLAPPPLSQSSHMIVSRDLEGRYNSQSPFSV